MHSLPAALEGVLSPFASLFSRPIWTRAQLLLVGAILSPGRRTVTQALRMVGLADERHFPSYHRVLSRATWSCREVSRVLLESLIHAFVPDGPLVFGLDETIERRWGHKIKARGIYRDPVRSSHGHFVKASGLRWLTLALLTPIPWASRIWALPVLTVLCPSERYEREGGRRHKSLLDWARQCVLQLRRWLPEREIIVVGDNTYAALEWLGAVQAHVTAITRLRLDARLYAPAPPRQPGTMGRPRKKGERLPSLEDALADENTPWCRVHVSEWYGGGRRELEIATGTAVWFHGGMPIVPIRWVLVRDPLRELAPKAFLCTDQDLDPFTILRYFVRRWQVEVTFEEARRHLGVESQRQWSDQAIARTTPCLLGLFSVVTLAADRMHREGRLRARQSAWYEKPHPTFSDALATVRRELWQVDGFVISRPETQTLKIPQAAWERLIEALAYAA